MTDYIQGDEVRNPHVVVERCVCIPIFVQEAVGVVDAEVFKVEEAVRKVLSHELDKSNIQVVQRY